MMSHRAYWVSQSRDVFVGSGLQDPTGLAGRFVGNLFEWRLRWKPTNGAWQHMTYEVGFSRLFKGSYFSRVPDSPGTADVNYVYKMVAASS